MNLIPVSIDSIHIGRPLPFHLVDKDGLLLAKKDFVVKTEADLRNIVERYGGIFIDGVDAEALQRAYMEQLQNMMRAEKSLGEIASAKLSADATQKAASGEPEFVDWYDLQEQTNYLLRDTHPQPFQERLERIHKILGKQMQRNADGTLFALVHLSAVETRMYSATHSLLVSAMCGLASRVLEWPEPIEALLRKAALTMNIGMTDVQDRLATQTAPPSLIQREAIDGHCEKSASLLQALGITDPTWLQAVRDHHAQLPGPMRSKTPAQRLARLIQRADMFAARLAPRSSRTPTPPAVAMQACYFDENKQVDEAGAALIKAVGIYQPGSFVRLATEEIAVVVRRGKNTSTPRVAVVVNRSGIPTVEPTLRDTSLKDYRVVASVAHRDVKVKVHLDRMLPLTQPPASERLW